ncbi:hypothetical protein DPMN_030477 [Dreissena polymorpha]|uniref:Uncharacterized protein n=1 Tax=Dreissena polymorpha TaxID=45954 RepID=A0A9D4LY89_DREPO|nr:hypothetical protein DPMN_030477 [Dreissena polymorpha]
MVFTSFNQWSAKVVTTGPTSIGSLPSKGGNQLSTHLKEFQCTVTLGWLINIHFVFYNTDHTINP